MAKVSGLIFVRFPKRDIQFHRQLAHDLTESGVDAKSVDTVSGYWNLNADWVQMLADVDTSWGGCTILIENNPIIEMLNTALYHEDAIGILNYVTTQDGKNVYTRHN